MIGAVVRSRSPNEVSSSSCCAITNDGATPAAAEMITAHKRRRVTFTRITGVLFEPKLVRK
jgi:hypothetical protein